MRNFKKILLRGILVFAFLFVFNKAVRFVYEAANTNSIYTIRDMKESKGEVETLILGTSLIHWGVNGQTLGEVIDSTTFNLATSAQPMQASYYLLKDMVKRNPVERVFLGVHATSMINDQSSNISVREGVFDRIRSPWGKLEYMLKTADWGEHEQYLFFSTRVENMLTRKRAKSTIKYKLGEEYKNNHSPEKQKYRYQGMGDENTELVYDGSFADEKLGADAVWNREAVLDINSKYLQKIADLCKKEGIELNLVVTPMTWEFTKLMGDLGDMHDYFQEFCDANDAFLYDFNQYEGIYDHLPNDCYQDKKHLNTKGAKILAKLLGDWYLES